MRKLTKFFGLPWSEKRLLVVAAVLLWSVQLGLWVLPFATLCRLLTAIRRFLAGRKRLDVAPVRRIVWAVTTMSRYVPSAACLTQALATQFLLDSVGQPASLGIGVSKTDEGQLEAHAWVEIEGDIVMGAVEDISRYTVLMTLR